MTLARRRHFRLVCEPETPRPWIVQYDDGPQAWKDTCRFARHRDATRYLADVRARDRALEETNR